MECPEAHASGSADLVACATDASVLHHRTAFVKNRIPMPVPANYPGEAYLEGMAHTLDNLAIWLESNA